ncbi:hypothetical protein DFH09DRAFT_1105820 [Mycena vulgaris]|nr:hypothetical protein DFH09DRAFT_1105820 [Mycena vulgaris]
MNVGSLVLQFRARLPANLKVRLSEEFKLVLASFEQAFELLLPAHLSMDGTVDRVEREQDTRRRKPVFAKVGYIIMSNGMAKKGIEGGVLWKKNEESDLGRREHLKGHSTSVAVKVQPREFRLLHEDVLLEGVVAGLGRGGSSWGEKGRMSRTSGTTVKSASVSEPLLLEVAQKLWLACVRVVELRLAPAGPSGSERFDVVGSIDGMLLNESVCERHRSRAARHEEHVLIEHLDELLRVDMARDADPASREQLSVAP